MLARVRSATLHGIEAATIFIEVDVTSGLPSFSTVGLPDATVRESRDRVRAAIRNSGLEFPIDRITVNLAPADVRKEGAAFDLPTAVGILSAVGLIKPGRLDRALVMGELSLDAGVRAVRGVLPVALHARREGFTPLLVPAGERTGGQRGGRHRRHSHHHPARRGRVPERRAGDRPRLRHAPAPLGRATATASTSPTCGATRTPSAASRSRRPAGTTC